MMRGVIARAGFSGEPGLDVVIPIPRDARRCGVVARGLGLLDGP